MKKIFIFKPTKHWQYCGGMLITTAASYEEACAKLKAGHYNDTLRFSKTDPDDIDDEIWVLFREFECLDNTPELCEVEYNYA